VLPGKPKKLPPSRGDSSGMPGRTNVGGVVHLIRISNEVGLAEDLILQYAYVAPVTKLVFLWCTNFARDATQASYPKTVLFFPFLLISNCSGCFYALRPLTPSIF